MTGFHHIFKNDYDKRIKVGGSYIFSYSAKKLKELYPEENYSLAGEAKNKLPKKKKNGKVSKAEAKRAELKIGKFSVQGGDIDVFPKDSHNKLLYKVAGYVCVGEGKFLAVHVSRIPFFAAVGSITAGIAAAVAVIVLLLANPEPPVIIDPDNPLPPIDPDIEPIEDDNTKKEDSPSGGGSVSMVYTKSVTVSLSSDTAEIYYQNPNASNHSVALELYIVSDGQEYLLGKTGLVPAGSAIYQLSVKDRAAEIRAGTYTGLYRVSYYEPNTGERAAVQAEVTGVEVTVTE